MLAPLVAFLVGLALGLWSAHRANKQLAAELKLEEVKLDDFRRELHHAGVSIARRDDEIERLEAKLLEANAELVLLRGDDDVPPEAA